MSDKSDLVNSARMRRIRSCCDEHALQGQTNGSMILCLPFLIDSDRCLVCCDTGSQFSPRGARSSLLLGVNLELSTPTQLLDYWGLQTSLASSPVRFSPFRSAREAHAQEDHVESEFHIGGPLEYRSAVNIHSSSMQLATACT